jgi:hypothetical protein
MNIRLTAIATIALTMGVAAAVPAIADTETTVTTVQKTTNHHYVYYGDHQIYFAPETKTYYWRSADTGPWQSGAELPVESRGYIKSGGVEIDLDTDHPYERHEWVVGHYKHLHDGDDKRDHDHDHDQH